jgi:hypothetical protein
MRVKEPFERKFTSVQAHENNVVVMEATKEILR